MAKRLALTVTVTQPSGYAFAPGSTRLAYPVRSWGGPAVVAQERQRHQPGRVRRVADRLRRGREDRSALRRRDLQQPSGKADRSCPPDEQILRERWLITLDADKAGPDYINRVNEVLDCFAISHTTASHDPGGEKGDRWRTIIPPAGPMTPTEAKSLATHYVQPDRRRTLRCQGVRLARSRVLRPCLGGVRGCGARRRDP